ncbi:MAG: iron ABC transporter ATP-binding protein [Bacteroidia bacterium]|nr:MAG: iron ABC transporter ATP-binding protein [Bacteroidia bacterium]
MQNEILHIDNVSIGYGKKKQAKIICSELNASINSGELVCMLGKNGAGKSTLIRTICGFQPALDGVIRLWGEHVADISKTKLSRLVAVVLTERLTIPNATVYELVSLGRSPYTGAFGVLNKKDKQMVADSVEKCGIGHKMYEKLSDLSDGEKQKAFIAKALAQDTKLIVLDEPTAFLDLPSRIEIVQLLRDISSTRNRAVLMSTHDMDLAMQMADKLWLLSDKDKLKSGSPEDLILSNFFQGYFDTRNIKFDNESRMFKVKHIYQHSLPTNADGLEFNLLSTAFARKGVELSARKNARETFVQLNKNKARPFVFYKNNELLVEEDSIERFVRNVLLNINQ